MKPPRIRRIIKFLKIAVLVYVLAGIALYYLQSKIVLHPRSLAADHVFSFPIPFKEVNLSITNERNLNIVQFTVPASARKGVVLYFHGNRNNIERYAEYADNFTKNNYEVWMMDYPGFGKSNGQFTEATVNHDAMQLYKLAASRFAADSIVIYGKSLGTGIAAYLAANTDCRQLILETPYYDMPSLMSHYAFMYPVDMMARFRFPTHDYLKRVHVPVTLIHGNRDEVIPYSQTKRLLKEDGIHAGLVTINGGRHNDLDQFQQFHTVIDSLLAR